MPAPTSALSAAYARLAATDAELTVTELTAGDPPPAGDGWVGADALAAGGPGLDAFLAWDAEQILRDHGREGRPDVVATFGLHRYAWPVCLLITVPWFLDRRVPRLPADRVAYDRVAGRAAVRPASFACLPDDPAAELPGAVVVPDEEALRAEVRAAVAEHMEPVLAGFGPRTRRRGRALWGLVTDDVVEGLSYVAPQFGPGAGERAVRELDLLLPGATAPYVGSAGFRTPTGPDGEPQPTRDRVSCCLFYTIDPQDACATCPRSREAGRIAEPTAAAAA
ncbi:(2Fe-2S)-binding protein [Streptomyces sp. NPDC026672]|uniref:(2Fe-2S)-binding protein n=1 Tax=unclassified Streptomyces TaxID=2593676 RepID=UPI0033F15273